jgi:hypothetical protein
MFFNLLYFAITNYIFGFIASASIGAIVGSSSDDGNSFLIHQTSRKVAAKMYLPAIVCIALVRLTLSNVTQEDFLRLLVVGTAGTMLLREAISSVIIATTVYLAQKN